jgi:hypothetical protein
MNLIQGDVLWIGDPELANGYRQRIQAQSTRFLVASLCKIQGDEVVLQNRNN